MRFIVLLFRMVSHLLSSLESFLFLIIWLYSAKNMPSKGTYRRGEEAKHDRMEKCFDGLLQVNPMAKLSSLS